MLFYIKDTCLKHPPKFFQKNESLNFGTRYSLLILDRQNCNADYLFLILLCPLKKLLILKYFLLNYFTILNFYLSPVLHFIEWCSYLFDLIWRNVRIFFKFSYSILYGIIFNYILVFAYYYERCFIVWIFLLNNFWIKLVSFIFFFSIKKSLQSYDN